MISSETEKKRNGRDVKLGKREPLGMQILALFTKLMIPWGVQHGSGQAAERTRLIYGAFTVYRAFYRAKLVCDCVSSLC